MTLAEQLSLIAKYNRPGPRYTSYPPANHFTEVEEDDPALWETTRRDDSPMSLYVHLPFCETLCWFCGCHTLTTRDKSRATDYLDWLEREATLTARQLQPGRPVEQLHFGGGTPNFLEPAQLDRLGDILRANFNFASQSERSVELDPRRLNVDHVAAFARMGVNRGSFGVQDSNPDVQEAIHRIQPQEMNVAAMNTLRDHGFGTVNIDLIYGLPRQTPDTFARTLDDALSLDPDRFAIFNYAHVPWMKPAQKILERFGLPDAETKLKLLQLCITKLTEAGYVYIGMDHFAKPDDELVRAQREKSLQRNFQGYSTRAGLEICGLGISAISQSADAYRQNEKDLAAYQTALTAERLPVCRGYRLTQEDKLRREVIMRLMCDLGLEFAPFESRWGIDFRGHFASALDQLDEPARDGLIAWTDGGFTVTEPGRLFIRNLAMCFDAYLKPAAEGRYSRTV
ncbi:MAG: oxygen-independent coproporphyrinogen III oxidase [Puniceicoccales bacterium]